MWLHQEIIITAHLICNLAFCCDSTSRLCTKELREVLASTRWAEFWLHVRSQPAAAPISGAEWGYRSGVNSNHLKQDIPQPELSWARAGWKHLQHLFHEESVEDPERTSTGGTKLPHAVISYLQIQYLQAAQYHFCSSCVLSSWQKE